MAVQRGVRGWRLTLAIGIILVPSGVMPGEEVRVIDRATLPAEVEKRIQGRLNEVQALIKRGQFAEARTMAESLIHDQAMKNKALGAMALLRHGEACLGMKDYVAAGRSLASLAPFEMLEAGVEARYLLGRVHHLSDEWPEAVANYEGAIAAFARQKIAADAASGNPAGVKQGDLREQLLRIARAGTPEYVTRAAIHLADLLMAQGKATEALNVVTAAIGRSPDKPLLSELRLRAGMAQVQLGKFNEARGLLEPLQAEPAVGKESLRWLAQVAVGVADSNNVPARAQALAAAAEQLKKAASMAATSAERHEGAQQHQAQILVELGDVLSGAGRHKEAAAAYESAARGSAALAEAALARQAGALYAAKEYIACEAVCEAFFKTHPYGAHAAEVGLRHAQSAAARMQESDAKGSEEVAARFQRVIERFPDSAQANAARRGVGLAHYRRGEYTAAAKVFAEVPELERTGELADVSFYQAESLMRTLPAAAEDAISSARLLKQLEQAVALLRAATVTEKADYLAAAFLQLGVAQGRMAELMADANERQAALNQARQALERVSRFKDQPEYAASLYERSRVSMLLNDWGGAINELRVFQQEPLKRSAVAPLAIVRMSEYLRQQKRSGEAVEVLKKAHQEHGPRLQDGAQQAGVLAMMRLELALALKESGKPSEAKDQFAEIIRGFPNRPEAEEAAWRAAQCEKEEAASRLAQARQKQDRKAVAEALIALERTAEELAKQVAGVAQRSPGSEVHLRLQHEVALAWRTIAESEVAAAREALQVEMKKRLEERYRQRPAGVELSPVRVGEVALALVPPQVAEKRARHAYAALMASGEGHALIDEARLELAQLHAERNEHEPAVTLLLEGLESGSSGPSLDRMRLALAVSLIEKGEPAEALPHLEMLAQDVRSTQSPAARYWLGEVSFRQKDWSKAIAQLLPFRQEQALRMLPGISDRAMLRLGQAYGSTGDWNASRSALESGLRRFPEGATANEMRFTMGMALEKTGQLDAAVAAYEEVVRRSATPLGAEAQYRIGLCRRQQKRLDEALKALLAAGYCFDISETGGNAMVQAGEILVEMKKQLQAKQVFERVTKEHAAGDLHEKAQKLWQSI